MNDPIFKNYKNVSQIYESKHTLLLRAVRQEDQQPVVIKFLKPEASTPKLIQQLSIEYERQRGIASPRVVKTLELLTLPNSIALVMEDFPHPSLQEIIDDPLPLSNKVSIAIEIARALGEIHHEQIIHKDIKPQNILVDRHNAKVKIIDFGISTLLGKELQQLLPPEDIEGTFPYMSPEQTGRINRQLDYRSDIYSLGVVLYQFFTGELPFKESSPLNYIHAHIAKQPPPPTTLPPNLGNILLKCLAKSSEERYHSAFGLMDDLSSFEEPNFTIGQRDIYDHFHFPEKLYGREREETQLLDNFEKVLKGGKILLTLSGNAGVGKSSLAAQGQKLMASHGGRFVQSKFDQFKRTVPYQGIATVLQKLVQKMLMEPEEQLQEWKKKFTEVLGETGQVLIDIVPDVEHIVGKQPPVLKLPPQETLNRIKYTLINFFKVLPRKGNPIILFLDDLQWADESSLNLLIYFFEDPAIKNFLIIAAYRDNEMTPSHPTYQALKEISDKGGEIFNLPVQPLTEDALQELIQDSYGGSYAQNLELGSLLYKKSQGNPFFALQLLKKLYEESLLSFDLKELAWKADLEKIAQLQVTDNVVDFLVDELKRVDPQILNLLKIGSAIESRFPLNLIAPITGFSEDAVRELLKEALRKDLVLQEEEGQSYRFMHDRIQQAVYSLLNEQEKNAFHEKIGRTLLSRTSKERLGEQVIEIVNHLNHADIQGWNRIDQLELAKLNLMAGVKAKDSGALLESIPYFRKGRELTSDLKGEKEENLAQELNLNLGTALLVTGGSEEAETILENLLQHSKNPSDQGKVWAIRLMAYAQQRNYDRLFTEAKKALALYGYHFEVDPSHWSMIKTLLYLKWKLLFQKIESIETMGVASDPNAHVITGILSSLSYPAFILNKKTQYIKNAVDIILITLNKGLTQNSANGIGIFSIFMGSEIMKKYEESYRLGKIALTVSNHYPKTPETASTIFSYYAFMHRWKAPLKDAVEPIKKAYKLMMETGAGALGATCAIYCNLIPLLVGENLGKIYENLIDTLNDIKKYSSKVDELSLCVHREVCHCLQGFTQDASDPLPPEFSEFSYPSNDIIGQLRYKLWHVNLCYLFGQTQKAVTLAKEVLKYIDNYPHWPEWQPFYFYYALSLIEMLKLSPSQEHARELKKSFKDLKRWGNTSPINYQHHSLIAQAYYSTLENTPRKTKDLFEMAIHAAKQSENVQDLALTYELFGKYFYEQGNQYGARILFQKSLRLYQQWGAFAKYKQLFTHYKNLLEVARPAANSKNLLEHGTSGKTSFGTTTQTLDVNTILEASNTLSREIVLDKLIESLMHLLIVNAGADRAFLILMEDSQFFVHSEIYLNNRYMPLPNPLPLEEKRNDLSMAIVNYVFRTGEPVLLEDAEKVGPFAEDPFIKRNSAHSVLCIPLQHKQKLAGILYLENRAAKGVFTSKKAKILTLLSSQIAVSVMNALLYEKMEMRIQERTQELQDKNKELQEAFKTIRSVQEQMLQKEKIASLGLMTAGIASELYSPLEQASTLIHTVQTHLNEIKQCPIGERNQRLKQISSELKMIEEEGRKADGVIKGLLSYAHKDASSPEMIDPLDLVTQALEHVANSFKTKNGSFHPKITITPQHSPLKIEGYPNDLIRVFVNIINNSYQAMYKKWQNDSLYLPQFSVTATKLTNNLEIKFYDNGDGIADELLAEIFTPFSLQGGSVATGFGLSIAKDIVVKEHGGSIEVTKHQDEFEVTITLPIA